MIFRAASIAVAACVSLCAGSVATRTAAANTKTFPSPPKGGATQKSTSTKDLGPKKASNGLSLLPGGGSREPININSDTLDFLNKEYKLIYTGHVVAIQGASTLKASRLDIDLEKNASRDATRSPAAAEPPAAGSSSVRHMEADGPVTLTSKDQVGTGDHATYDKGENKVYLNGNVTLTQGPSVIQGDALVYDMPSGQARVSGNVRSVFSPPDSAESAGARTQADRSSAH